MKDYLLYTQRNLTGEKSYFNLQEDLRSLLIKHNAVSSFLHEDLLSSTLKMLRVFEIPGKGALNIVVSSRREMEIEWPQIHGPLDIFTKTEIIKVDGLVSCLGFDESSEYFKKLDADLNELCNVYSPDRSK